MYINDVKARPLPCDINCNKTEKYNILKYINVFVFESSKCLEPRKLKVVNSNCASNIVVKNKLLVKCYMKQRRKMK